MQVLKDFPYIKYTLELCRKTEFYTFHYIMPTLVISILALASFVVHPESGDKVCTTSSQVLSLVINIMVLHLLLFNLSV